MLLSLRCRDGYLRRSHSSRSRRWRSASSRRRCSHSSRSRRWRSASSRRRYSSSLRRASSSYPSPIVPPHCVFRIDYPEVDRVSPLTADALASPAAGVDIRFPGATRQQSGRLTTMAVPRYSTIPGSGLLPRTNRHPAPDLQRRRLDAQRPLRRRQLGRLQQPSLPPTGTTRLDRLPYGGECPTRPTSPGTAARASRKRLSPTPDNLPLPGHDVGPEGASGPHRRRTWPALNH